MNRLRAYPPPAVQTAMGAYLLAKAGTKKGMRDIVRAEEMLRRANAYARVPNVHPVPSEMLVDLDNGAKFLRQVIAIATKIR